MQLHFVLEQKRQLKLFDPSQACQAAIRLDLTYQAVAQEFAVIVLVVIRLLEGMF